MREPGSDRHFAVAAPGEALGGKNNAGSVNVLYGSTLLGLAAAGNQLWHQEDLNDGLISLTLKQIKTVRQWGKSGGVVLAVQCYCAGSGVYVGGGCHLGGGGVYRYV